MDHIHAPPDIPHIIQVYQPAVTSTKIQNPQIIHISHPSLQSSDKVTYEQAMTTESLHVPVTDISNQMPSQIVMSCQQTHLQNMPTMQSQVLPTELSQALQFTSHMLLPQHMLVDRQYFGQYDNFVKEPCVVPKMEPEPQLSEKNKQANFKPDNIAQETTECVKKKNRSHFPDPDSWACNVRKLKHQRGEAYVNRRGKFVPERKVRTTKDCLTSCKYKCNVRINDTDREHIFKAFYSLNANEKKHFLLNTTERSYVAQRDFSNGRKKYSFKYFFLVRSIRYTVCKNFYLGTLAISQKPVYNVHLGKSEMNIPKPDGRGLSETSAHALPSEIKDRVRTHIMSFKTVDSKCIKQFSRKKQYLDASLSIKLMFTKYVSDCSKNNLEPVKESMYRKIFKEEFNIHFRKVKTEQQLCCKCKGPVKKK